MLLPKKGQNLTPDSDDTKRKGGNTHLPVKGICHGSIHVYSTRGPSLIIPKDPGMF